VHELWEFDGVLVRTSLKLPYQLHAEHGLVPLCEVVLIGRTRRVLIRAVIDSGATHPFFLKSHAEDAGLDVSKGRPFPVTFGGSTTEGRLLDVYLEISGRRLRAEAVFVDDIKLGYSLLGRRTVFNQFREVAFIERSKSPCVELRD
jgi:hypothetical protein